MAKQTINVGAAPNDGTGDPLRTAMIKANDNFTELYLGKDAVTVANFSALPAPASATGERWWVLASTGVWLVNRHNKGAYYSDGTVWNYLGDFPQAAAEVSFTPVGIITATETQAAVAQLEAEVASIPAPGLSPLQTSAFTFTSLGPRVLVDTTSGAITGTLPASPAVGARSLFSDAADFSVNALTIGRNGELIEGVAENMTVSTKNTSGGFVFVGGSTGWKAIKS